MTHQQKDLEANIREEIDRLLDKPLNDAEWSHLLKVEKYVREIQRTPWKRTDVISEAAENIQNIRKNSEIQSKQKKQEKRKKSKLNAGSTSQRTQAISRLIAQEAAENPSVLLFRKEVLDDKLLHLEEIEEWIQQQTQKDGPSTYWLTNIPISQIKANELIEQLSKLSPDVETFSLEIPVKLAAGYVRWEQRTLAYPMPENEWAFVIPTAVGGTLERLRKLGEELAQTYKWEPQQATAFILTDQIPLINPINITIRASSRSLSSRIVLDIDPALLSPPEVAQHYRRNRKKIIAIHHRNIGAKSTQLALVNPPVRKNKETWATKMDEWNRTQEAEWRYQTLPNFIHECKKARKRLLRTGVNSLVIFGHQGLPR